MISPEKKNTPDIAGFRKQQKMKSKSQRVELISFYSNE